MSDLTHRSEASPGEDAAMAAILEVSREMREALAGGTTPPPTPATRLQQDLGLDSLSRMELLSRIEQRHGLRLDERRVMDAETLADVRRAVLQEGEHVAAVPADPTPRREETVDLDPGAALACPTLVHALEWHAAHQPDRVHVHYIDENGEETPITYDALESSARRVACGLAARGLGPGDTVAIMLPTGPEYLFTFLGCMLAGVVPVPIYPPARAKQIEEHFRRHGRLLANAGVRLLVTVPEALTVSRLLSAEVPTLDARVTPAQLAESAAVALPRSPAAEDLAFLQYTSGSTGDPKGVMLSHHNLMASLRSMAVALDASHRDVFVSWLPLYHDMGLIGAWMGALVAGFPLVLMSPLTFLARPQRWLEAISRHRATISGGPNFAYELCLRRIPDDALATLDLSSWRAAFNGAEPVSASTMKRFHERFSRCGLDAGAMTPVYGLAEATLGVCFTPPGRGPRIEAVAREALYARARALPADAGADPQDVVWCVSSGTPIPGFEIRVVSPAGAEQPERFEGAVQFRGPGATAGYFHNPTATRALKQGDWTATGDRGFTVDGELFITGRDKDVVIRAGRNLYPYALEGAVAEVPGVRRGCVAVFATVDPTLGTESLVVVAETRVTAPGEREAMREAIHALALTHLGLPADEVVLAPPHTVLKTSSGKIRRSALAEAHAKGRLVGHTQRAVWLQVIRLGVSALLPVTRRALASAAERLHAGWCALSLVLVLSVTWPAIMLARTPHSAWRRARRGARILLWLCRIDVQAPAWSLPEGGGLVIVSNHQSFLDALVMLVALPRPVRFVAKRELARSPAIRRLLDALGVLFVERFDGVRAVADSRALVAALAAGEPLLYFPEGTFHRMAGLLPFQLGAFEAAVDAGVPIQPLVILGSRHLLRGDDRMPRPGRIELRVLPLVARVTVSPTQRWQAAVALRRTVRDAILAGCGEPDLAEHGVRTRLDEDAS